MLKEHKQILEKFIKADIETINMYWGYKGDFILKLTVKNPNLVNLIEDYCKQIGVDCVVKHETSTGWFNLFCVAIDEDVYELKFS
jgi:hypothetical protein